MRSTDEQLRTIRQRAARIRARRRSLAQIAAVCVCLVLIAVVSFTLPQVRGDASFRPAGSYGSVILTSTSLGYVIIGVLAFALGVSVTLLSVHLAGQRRAARGDHERDA